MARNLAEVRGRAKVRPFRVAQLVDATSAEDVRAAIVNLTVAWGGVYTPIIDMDQSFDDIEWQARMFDVDALHIETDGELADRLRNAGWLWRGRGEFGPFAEPDGGFRTGTLPASVLALDHRPLLLPEWDHKEPLDLFYTAAFGAQVGHGAAAGRTNAIWEPAGSRRVGLGALYVTPDVTLDDVGAIHATNVGVSPEVRHYLDGMNGLFVIRPDNVGDIVNFWNLRTFGRPIVPLPADGPTGLLSLLTRGTLPGSETRQGSDPRVEKHLVVWGLEDASKAARAAIDAMAQRLELAVRGEDRRGEGRLAFPGLDSHFKSSIRAEFPPNARSLTVQVPSVPLVTGSQQAMPGTVAVEIDLHGVSRLDPRFALSLPPLRRFGLLLERSMMHQVDHIRVTSEGDGVVLGVSASSDEVPIGFAYHLDAIQTLFDDKDLKVSQSDDGRFQTRAAEMLGGPFGGVMAQPGVRALIDKAARSTAGLTLQQLKAEIERHHGHWPGKLAAFHTTTSEYAEGALNNLLLSGLFVPMLDVHCSNCRVESQVSPRDLDATIQCEFCGESFRLAVSLAISRSKSRWRFRLASHLGPEKVKALLPALATTSLLGQLSGGSAAATHAFGVEFKFAGDKRVEADIVAYLTRPDWAVTVGEVKNSNWIDANDVRNLEELQHRLDEKKVRSVLTFATLKDRLAEEELKALRGLVERGKLTTTAFGAVVPRVPLVLTAGELSMPWDDEDHPNRWTRSGGGHGIFTTAIESCRRNLGLVELKRGPSQHGRPFTCRWEEPPITEHESADVPREAI